MNKILLLFFAVFSANVLIAQTEPINITFGGERNSSFCKGTGNPNTVFGNQFGAYECTNFTDTVTGQVWRYVPIATPKWLPTLDSAGNYMNQNKLGIIDLGGVAEQQVTYLNMGTHAQGRAVAIGNFDNSQYPSSTRSTNNYGLHLSSPDEMGESGIYAFQSNAGGKIAAGTSNGYLEYLANNRTNGVSTETWNWRNKIAQGQLAQIDNSFVGNTTATNHNSRISMYRDMAVAGTYIIGDFAEFATRTQAFGVDRVIGYQKVAYDIRDAGNAAVAKHYLNTLMYSPNSNPDTVRYYVHFGESSSNAGLSGSSLSNLKIPSYIKGFYVTQNTFGATPSPFHWLSIDYFDNTQTGNKVGFYNRKYFLPNAAPSITNGVKNVIVWTGNGSDATPAFETMSGGGSSIYTAHGSLFGTRVEAGDGKYLNLYADLDVNETQRFLRLESQQTSTATERAVFLTAVAGGIDSLALENTNGSMVFTSKGEGASGLRFDIARDFLVNADTVRLLNNSFQGITISPTRIGLDLPPAERSSAVITITNGGSYTPSNLIPFHRLSGAAGGATTYTITLPANATNLAEYTFHFEGAGTGFSINTLTWNPPAGETTQNIGYTLPSPKPGVTYKWKKIGTEWHLTGCSGCGL